MPARDLSSMLHLSITIFSTWSQNPSQNCDRVPVVQNFRSQKSILLGKNYNCSVPLARVILEQSNMAEAKYKTINKSRMIYKIKYKTADRILTWKTQMGKTTGSNKQIIYYNDERVQN